MDLNSAKIKTAKIGSLCIILPKNSTAGRYKYADHATQLAYLRPHLESLNLGVSQSTVVMDDIRFIETTSICCDDGSTYKTLSELVMGEARGMNANQALGSAETYTRRYGLSKHFNLSSDDDNDGATYPEQPSSKQKTEPHHIAEEVISPAQLKRLHTIIANSPWTADEAKEFMRKTCNVGSSKDLNQRQYNQFCSAIEHYAPPGKGQTE